MAVRMISRCSVVLALMLLLWVSGMVPQVAYAVEDGLVVAVMQGGSETETPEAEESITTGSVDGEEALAQEEAAAASIKYAVTAGSSWAWATNGETAQASGANQFVGVRMQLDSATSGSLQYQVNLNGSGWQAPKGDNAPAGGETAKSKRIESLRIALSGEISQWYDVEYRVKFASGTWQAWKKNGAVAGKAGKALAGLQVKLMKKPAKATSAAPGIIGVRYRVALGSSKWQKWMASNAIAGKTAQGKRIKRIALALDKGSLTGGITYRVRLSSGKWKPWKKNGKSTGTYGNIEAIQIKLTGEISKTYDVVYRTYVRGVGWQARMRNGATAGTGKGRRVQAIRVQIVPKSARDGWVNNGSSWSYYKKGKILKGTWLQTNESPINVMTTKNKRYWLDAEGKLAVSRIVDPAVAQDAGAAHAAYASKWGYTSANSKIKTPKGLSFSDGNGFLKSQAGWMKTAVYDGEEEIYRLKKAGSYAVATTGLFKVDGKQYYGWPKEGYIMRDMTKKFSGKWRTADSAGVLGAATSAQIHIERYVQWAIGIANDNSHGYTQDTAGRWGPDYDCSSLVISSLKNTGLSVGGAIYTGNMISELTVRGFKWHTDLKNIKRGDILLVHKIGGRQHTEIYIGKGKTVGAHIAETGGIYGRTGDQTGNEISVAPYSKIWQGYLRFGS